jgi:two-component system sensor histidine kinase ChvG
MTWLRLSQAARSLGFRLFLVNVVVVLVPWAGLEYARWHERRLLAMLEQGMRDQAALVRAMAESGLGRERPLTDPALADALHLAAIDTRTRVRLLDSSGAVISDSHDHGPPEGPESPIPPLLGSASWSASSASDASSRRASSWSSTDDGARWPDIAERSEVRDALQGRATAITRIRDREPQVFLFLTEPIRVEDQVVGVVYVTRSTQPVLSQMHRLRQSLIRLLIVSLAFTLLVSAVLSWTIARPIERLAAAARRISRGDRNVKVPEGGPHQVRELAAAVASLVREQEQRMRYIEGFTADVAHELKSPLTSIRGAAELLRDGASDPGSEQARFLANIEHDAERMNRLVSRLLELSRIDASEAPMVDVNLDEVIARVIERTDTSEQPVRSVGDRGLRARGRKQDLERALLNLVENALRFSPPGEPIEIEVHRKAHMVHIAVRDRGPGVPSELRDRVFDRFFTTDSERTGTGLGLAIVRAVAERAGGTATLEASESGASFVIALHPP